MFGFFRSHSSPQNDGSGGCSCSKQLLNHYSYLLALGSYLFSFLLYRTSSDAYLFSSDKERTKVAGYLFWFALYRATSDKDEIWFESHRAEFNSSLLLLVSDFDFLNPFAAAACVAVDEHAHKRRQINGAQNRSLHAKAVRDEVDAGAEERERDDCGGG